MVSSQKRLLGVVWCDLGPPRQPVKDHSQLCDDRLPPCVSEPTLQKVTLSIQRVFRRAFFLELEHQDLFFGPD